MDMQGWIDTWLEGKYDQYRSIHAIPLLLKQDSNFDGRNVTKSARGNLLGKNACM